MADSLNNFFNSSLDTNKWLGLPIEAQIRLSNNGVKRTEGGSPNLLQPLPNDRAGNVRKPGFTPLMYYKGEDLSVNLDQNINTSKVSSARDKFVVTQDVYTDAFKDDRQDNFRHDLSNLVPIATIKNDRHTFDGKETTPFRLNQFKGSPYENNDPIAYSYELVINTNSSPLFNGSIDDFINMFSGQISEIASRKPILEEFKQQFYKFFKTNEKQSQLNSVPTTFAQVGEISSVNTNYLSYYLKKIAGLENLIESNTSEKQKSFVEYRKDKITLSFNEDVSLSIGTLASLYKLLYWSRLNGKNLIPENLLRFDCFIIVSEVRNFQRVRKAINSQNPGMAVEVLADNLSRYVYNLYECQLYFDKMSHPADINLGEEPKIYGAEYDVTFDYKYSTMKFEKWVPDKQLFGKYAVLSNDRIDPLYVGPNETKNATIDFGTASGYSSISFEEDTKTPIVIDIFDPGNYYNPSTSTQSTTNTGGPKGQSYLDKLKDKTIKNATTLAKKLEHNLLVEAQGQINKRFALLNDSLDKIRNASGIGKMSQPTNVYEGYYDKVSQTSGLSTRFFYDLHNSLRDFGGDQLGSFLPGGH